MNFSCPSCFAKYYVADERVVGRTLKMKCRRCPFEIPIQGRVESRRYRSSSEPPSSSRPPSSIWSDRFRFALAERRGASLSCGGTVPDLPSETEVGRSALYRVVIAGSSRGPFELSELNAAVLAGELNRYSFVWRPGLDRWMRMHQVDELAALGGERDSEPPSSSSPLSVRTDALVDVSERGAVIDGRANPERTSSAEAGQERATYPSRQPESASAAASPGPADGSSSEAVATEARIRWEESPSTPAASSAAPRPVSTSLKAQAPHSGLGGKVAVALALVSSLGLGFVLGSILSGRGRQGSAEESSVSVLAERSAFSQGADSEASDPMPVAPKALPRSEAPPKDAQAVETAQEPPPTHADDASLARVTSKRDNPGKGTYEPKTFDASRQADQSMGKPTAGQDEGPPEVTGALTSAAITQTVARYQRSVSQQCWQPALEGRGQAAQNSARVLLELTVTPAGVVSDVQIPPDPAGYPGLSRCIASAARVFRFPEANEETRVGIPFVFVMK